MDQAALSQEEMDTLLQDAAAPEAGGTDDSVFVSGEPRPYDLANPTRVVRGPVPGLEKIHEGFSKSLREALAGLLPKPPLVTVSPVVFQNFGAFMRRIDKPASFNVVGLRPFTGTGLIVFDPALVNALVDCLFGGGGLAARSESRAFSATEQSIILRLVQLVVRLYGEAWPVALPLQMEYLRSEVEPEAVAIASANDMMVCVTLTIGLDPLQGDLHICMPFSSLESVRDVLFAPLQGDRSQGDPSWLGMMSRQIEEAEVEVVAHLAEIQSTVRGLLSLRVGQVLECQIPPELTVSVEGIPFLECQYGIQKGHYALRVRKFLTQVDQFQASH